MWKPMTTWLSSEQPCGRRNPSAGELLLTWAPLRLLPTVLMLPRIHSVLPLSVIEAESGHRGCEGSLCWGRPLMRTKVLWRVLELSMTVASESDRVLTLGKGLVREGKKREERGQLVPSGGKKRLGDGNPWPHQFFSCPCKPLGLSPRLSLAQGGSQSLLLLAEVLRAILRRSDHDSVSLWRRRAGRS